MKTILLSTVLACAAAGSLAAQTDADSCPLHARHMAAAHDQEAALDQRGDQVMGFEHARTAHHFLLTQDGGAIQVEATDPKDRESLAQIRSHLTQVASALPMATSR